jgi:hypothetical protein
MSYIGNSLAQGLISGANIQDGTVDTPDLKNSAVTAAKLADGAVTADKLAPGLGGGAPADGSISTAKLADGAVTSAKLAAGAAVVNIGFTPAAPSQSFFIGTTQVAINRASASLALNGVTLPASAITSGTIAAARLGSGSPQSWNFLRGDGTWAAPSINISQASSGNPGVVYGGTSTSDYNALLGYQSSAGYQAVAIGGNAYSTTFGVASGYYGNASGEASIAMGYRAEAFSARSIAIGDYAKARGQSQVVIGGSSRSNEGITSPAVLIGGGIENTASGPIVVLRAGLDTQVQSYQEPGFYVNAVTEATGSQVLYYNPQNGKVTYGAVPSGGGSEEPEPEPTVVSSPLKPAQTFFDSSSSGYTSEIGFTTPTEKDYMLAVLQAMKSVASNGGGIQMIRVIRNGYVNNISIDQWSNIGSYGSTVTLNNTYYSRSYYPQLGPTENSISLRVFVNAIVSSSPSTVVVAASSSIYSLLTSALTENNLPYSFTAYQGNYANNTFGKTVLLSSGTVSGPAVAVTGFTAGSLQSGTITFENSFGGFTPTPVSFTEPSAYIDFILGVTTYVEAGAGGGAYTPDWYSIAINNPGPTTPSYAVQFGSSNSTLPLPSGWNPAQALGNYKVVGFGSSHAPWGEQFYWTTGASYAEYFENEPVQYTVYWSNPNQIPSPWGYYGYQSNGFAALFLMPGPNTNGVVRPNSFYSMGSQYVFARNTWANSISHSSASQSSFPPSGLRYRLVAYINSVSPNFVASLNPSITATKFDQFLQFDQNRGAYACMMFLTINDNTTAQAIAQNGIGGLISFNEQVQAVHLTPWFEY